MEKRVIKFRAWDTDFKKMLLLNDAKFVNGVLIGAKGIYWDSKVIVQQFTGLKDKNGKEIYEGDIVKVIDGTSKGYVNHPYVPLGTNLEVGWDDVNGGWYVDDENGSTLGYYCNWGDWNWLEVIGNIWENSDLLKENNE